MTKGIIGKILSAAYVAFFIYILMALANADWIASSHVKIYAGIFATIPPVWFIFEYWFWPPKNSEELSLLKFQQELASKVWISLSSILGVLIALNR